MNAPVRKDGKPARDFTFIQPSHRRLSEYEALTVHQQPDSNGFDRPGGSVTEAEWSVLRHDGSAPWRPESTKLHHPDWYAYRDPAQHWQRTYVRHQEQQESSIERVTEDAGLNGTLAALPAQWVGGMLSEHYRAWSFFEYAIFRALAPAQREALADTLGNVICFQSFDHLRHAQDIVVYLVELENYHGGVKDAAGKQAWLEDPAYQPARRLAERIIGTNDWGELLVALNLVVAPLVQQIAVSDLVRRNASLSGDVVAAHIVLTAERDRRRNLAAGQAFVQMVTDADLAEAGANRAVIEEWLDRWRPVTEAACMALAPVFARTPQCAVTFEVALEAARTTQAGLLSELGLRTGAQS